MDDLYGEMIVDHYKNPRNFGKMEDYTHKSRGANASCGDLMEFYFRVGNDGKQISKVGFAGVGCALSTAAASMLVEKIEEEKLDVKQVREIGLDDLISMMGIEITPTRMKCVELSYKVMQEALENK